MLWMLGLVAIGFCYIGAVSLDETRVTADGVSSTAISTECQGLWNPSEWFDSACQDSLPARLGAMVIGVMGLIVCAYFAEKARVVDGRHRMKKAAFSSLRYCAYRGCHFRTRDVLRAEEHSELRGTVKRHDEENNADRERQIAHTAATAGSLPVPQAPALSGFEPPAQRIVRRSTVSPASDLPNFQDCPDCAELVRAAARKCRFCGYLFAPAATQPASGPRSSVSS